MDDKFEDVKTRLFKIPIYYPISSRRCQKAENTIEGKEVILFLGLEVYAYIFQNPPNQDNKYIYNLG